jgi:3-oxoacyl-[acyl-carrier-protein] synthase II
VRAPVGVSGIGVVSPFGTTRDAFTTALHDGRSAVAPVDGFDMTGCRTTLAAQMKGFDPAAWVPPMKLRRVDRTGVYAVAVTRLAFDDAGRASTPDGDDRTGVVLGTWSAGGGSTQQYLDALFEGGPTHAPALLFESTVGNAAASLAAMEFKLRGPNATVSHKEASGLAAIVAAVDLLRGNRADGLIAGGVDALFETFFKGHDRFRVMSSETVFSRRLAPFDAERAGFVLGEGGFGLWLERAAAGRHGQILGVAAAGAAVPLNAWPDRPEPLIRTMRLALEDAALTPADVDVVYASANASRSLDAVEAAALTTLFGGSRTVVTSLKGALGESGATGAASCAAALLCGRDGWVPPTAGLAVVDGAAAGLRVARDAVLAPGPIALINSFASGGALFSAILRVTA